MQVTAKPQIAALPSGPTPIAPELLKLIGGGAARPATTQTPQAPKNTW